MPSLSRRLIVIPGLLGALVVSLGSLITAFAYTGSRGQSYSPFNHFISELGHTQQSALAAVFNITVIIGGLSFILFMEGVGLKLRGIARQVIATASTITGITGALVGVFPVNEDLNTHQTVAALFLLGALIMLISFALAAWFGKERPYPRWLALAALPAMVCIAYFLLVALSDGENALAPPPGEREPFWIIAMSEWGALIFLLAWIMALTLWQIAHPDR